MEHKLFLMNGTTRTQMQFVKPSEQLSNYISFKRKAHITFPLSFDCEFQRPFIACLPPYSFILHLDTGTKKFQVFMNDFHVAVSP